MTVVYNTTVKSTRMQMVADYIDSKTLQPSTGAPAAGKLVIGTSALSGATGVLATLTLPTPCGTVSNGVLTLGTVPSAAATAGGTAAKAEIRNNADTPIITGLTVNTLNADILIATTTIASGQTVQVTSGTITHG